eukprot:4542388-Heterocapsa_arctica.AAC.1
MAWLGKDTLGHGIAVVTVERTPEGTVLNVEEVSDVTTISDRLSLVTHDAGTGDEAMTLVGGHVEPPTNISTKEDFLNPPGGNKDIYPHATLDSCVVAAPGSIATAFLKDLNGTSK